MGKAICGRGPVIIFAVVGDLETGIFSTRLREVVNVIFPTTPSENQTVRVAMDSDSVANPGHP